MPLFMKSAEERIKNRIIKLEDNLADAEHHFIELKNNSNGYRSNVKPSDLRKQERYIQELKNEIRTLKGTNGGN